jgi:hypothetical protein
MPTLAENRTKELTTKNATKVLSVALGALAATGVGLKAVERNTQPVSANLNGPHKEYVVRPHDTVSGITSRAYPDRDWRAIEDVVENQLPVADRKEHILRTGEKLVFNVDSKIGEMVDGSNNSSSGG